MIKTVLKRRHSAFVSACALFCTLYVQAANIVTIDGGNPGKKLDGKLFGVNLIYTKEKNNLWNDGIFRDLLSDMKIRALRYPGGEVTSTWRIWDATGQNYVDSWDPAFNPSTDYKNAAEWMDVWEYRNHVDAITSLSGASYEVIPFLGINIESGYIFNRDSDGINVAKQVAKWVVNNNINVGYYYIDNESWIAHYGTGTWMNATTYANYVVDYAAAIRSIDSDAKIMAAWRDETDSSDWHTLLDICGSVIDGVDIHPYLVHETWGDANWDDYYAELPVERKNVRYRNIVSHLRNDLNSRGLNGVKIAALEWNHGEIKDGETMSGYQAAFINAEIFWEMIQGGLDYSCFWPMWQRTGDWKHSGWFRLKNNDTEIVVNPTYYSHKNFRYFAGQKFLDASSNWQRTRVYSTQATNGSQIKALLLRKASSGADVRVDITGFNHTTDLSKIKILRMTPGNNDLNSNSMDQTNITPTLDSNGRIKVFCPPYSMTRLIIPKA